MREKIYNVIEPGDKTGTLSDYYDGFMIVLIVLSLIPLAYKSEHTILIILDKSCAVIFLADYLLRWITADYKFRNHSVLSFVRYPFSVMAVIDLLSILPSFSLVNRAFKALRLFRIFRALRILRVFKMARYSKSVKIIIDVFRKSKDALAAVGTLAVVYILVSALVILNVEPDSFNNFFDAVYWATISLTTMGYGDIYPVSAAGRAVTMVSSIFGIAIVALPAGIITAGYMAEVQKDSNNETEQD